MQFKGNNCVQVACKAQVGLQGDGQVPSHQSCYMYRPVLGSALKM